MKTLAVLAGALALAAGLPGADAFTSNAAGTVELDVEVVARGLEHPWSVETLPGGGLLVSERPGRLRIVENGRVSPPVAGLPDVAVRGQGGLLDLALSPDFAETGIIYFTFSEPGWWTAGTAVARARLVRDDGVARLEDVAVIFSMDGKTRSDYHFGSRIAIANDGALFFTIGDRGDQDRAQDFTDHAGAVLRIGPDGAAPAGNPFAGGGAGLPEIWSKGHRNPQGVAIDPATGAVYTVEHGAQGGDEINQPQPGRNYGWPIISYGRHYSGEKIGLGTAADGYEQPLYYWDPSIAPGALAIYGGAMFPEWENDFLVTALKAQMLVRVRRAADGGIVGEERLLEGRFGRMRDVTVAPDGALLITTDDDTDGAILRISRAGR